MDYPDFIIYLEEKYGVRAEKLNTISNDFSISHYYYKGKAFDTQETILSYNYPMSKETYAKLNGSQKEGWYPKSIFDYENELNESKRTIKMLRSNYVNEFKTQFKDLING
jgi:hypothetical protein